MHLFVQHESEITSLIKPRDLKGPKGKELCFFEIEEYCLKVEGFLILQSSLFQQYPLKRAGTQLSARLLVQEGRDTLISA